MKKLVLSLIVTSGYAYNIYSDRGGNFSGSCSNGSTFAGTKNSSWYSVTGPNGNKTHESKSVAIRLACGE